MTAKQIITNKLMEVLDPGDVRAGCVWKGWHHGDFAWHYEPFNAQVVWLGKNLEEALETIELMNEDY